MYREIIVELKKLRNPRKAKDLTWFFKTGKGEYGEGDIFWGIMVPQQRAVVRKYFKEVMISDIQKLLQSPVHEQRLAALLMLVAKFLAAQEKERTKIFRFYLQNTRRINNWDLVDLSSWKIVGEYLQHKDRKILYQLAKSKNVWERRIAIVSTAAFIRENDFEDTFKISKILLNDDHDLIHKAVGWMLREAGKRDEKKLIEFLSKNYSRMPRTMLRYAIERFPEKQRQAYLKR